MHRVNKRWTNINTVSWSDQTNSATLLSFSPGHFCQSVSGGRSLFRLQHRRLQVLGRHDSAHSAQPQVALRLLHCPHQQEASLRLHLCPEGEQESRWTQAELMWSHRRNVITDSVYWGQWKSKQKIGSLFNAETLSVTSSLLFGTWLRKWVSVVEVKNTRGKQR